MHKAVELVYVPANSPAVRLLIPFVAGMTVADVLSHSGLQQTHPEVDGLAVGIFSQGVALSHPVHPGDRVEVYRPLISCPKEKRRKRALGR